MKDQWLAVCLSSIFPGAGQIYSGSPAKGLCFISVQTIAVLLAFFALFWWATGNSIVPFATLMLILDAFPIYNLFDAYYTAKHFNTSRGEPRPEFKKQPFLAVYLSEIIPGLGQLYNAQWLKGIGFFLIVTFAAAGLKIFGLIGGMVSEVFEILATSLIFYDAYANAQKRNGLDGNIFHRWSRSNIYRIVLFWIIFRVILPPAIAVGIRTYYCMQYKIPTGAMSPVLQPEDYIIANKWIYQKENPKRGDIAVFEYPKDPKKEFIKRIVGLPGETLVIKNGQIHVNGHLLDTPQIPKERFYYNRNDWEFGREGQIIKIPDDSYFVIGDNSSQSSDSRSWGFLPRSSIKAKATEIWWPVNRWKRIG